MLIRRAIRGPNKARRMRPSCLSTILPKIPRQRASAGRSLSTEQPSSGPLTATRMDAPKAARGSDVTLKGWLCRLTGRAGAGEKAFTTASHFWNCSAYLGNNSLGALSISSNAAVGIDYGSEFTIRHRLPCCAFDPYKSAKGHVFSLEQLASVISRRESQKERQLQQSQIVLL